MICPITQEEIVCEYKLGNCGHVFEMEAILQWLKDNDSCPMCRKSICVNNKDNEIQILKIVAQELNERIELQKNILKQFKDEQNIFKICRDVTKVNKMNEYRMLIGKNKKHSFLYNGL